MKEIDCIYDMDGNQIKVGDTVVCIARARGYGELTTAKVVKLHPKMVTLEYAELETRYHWNDTLCKSVESKVNRTNTVRHNAVYFCRGAK